MIDSKLIKWAEFFFYIPAQYCVDLKISANTITFLGGFLVLPLVYAIYYGYYKVAIALLVLNRIADGLDGAVARFEESRSKSKKKSKSLKANSSGVGSYADIVADYLFYVGVPLAFAFHDRQENSLAVAVLLASFVMTAVTFLGFSVMAMERNIVNPKFAKKGFYYFSGMVEGAETIVFFIICLLLPQYFATLAFFFAGACVATAIMRFFVGYKTLKR